MLAGKLGPQCLPENNYPHATDIRDAYNQCLALERCDARSPFVPDFQTNGSQLPSQFITADMSPRVAARVLGYALLFAPSEEGRKALTREIIACLGDHELLVGLADLYVLGLVRLFYSPAVSGTASLAIPIPQAAEDVKYLLEKPSLTAKDLGQLIFFRDENRCIFTGAVDVCAPRSSTSPVTKWCRVEVTHIISQSLSDDVHSIKPSVRDKFEWAKAAGTIIEHFAGFSPHDVLGDDGLNSPLNTFAASGGPYKMFGQLDMWFTPAEDERQQVIPHTYDVRCCWGDHMLCDLGAGVRPRVTFRTVSLQGKTIQPPDSRIIALHAACARIAHMSGAVEYLQELFQDID